MATQNKDLIIKKEVSDIVKKAQKISIENADDMKNATEFLSTVNKKLDAVTEEKEKITKPLNEALKVERARWKPIESDLEEAIRTTKKAMIDFQTQQRKIEIEKQNKIASRVGEGKGKLKIETAAKKMGEIKTVESNVAADSGSVKFKTVKCFAVEDISKLPTDCVVPDMVEIRRKMNGGIEVLGVKYWTEERPSNFR